MKEQTTTHWRHNLAKGLTPFLIAGLMSLALAGLVWAAGYFGHKVNMSRTSSRRSAYPHIAANGTYVALAWSEGYATSNPGVVKHYGPVYLRYTTDISNSYWYRIVVHNSNALSNNSRDPRLDFDPDSPQVHIVWSNHDESLGGASVNFNRLRYTTCDLTDRSCTSLQDVVSTTGTESFLSPDVAVDSTGKAHVVWVRSDTNDVYYSSSPFTSRDVVASGGSQPVIAVANNDVVHVAWLDSASGKIKYKRKSGGAWGGDVTFDRERSGRPAIDALNNTVYLVWDHRETGTDDSYAIVYALSTNNGSSWDYGTSSFNIPSGDATLEFRQSPPGGNSSPGGGYSTGLQPDVTLAISESNTLAHVVWHAYKKITGGEEDPTYEYFDIWYSLGNHSLGWTDPEINLTEDGHEHQQWTLEPVIAIGLDDHVHVAYMQTTQDVGTGETWGSDVYYDGYIELDPGSVIYLPSLLKNN
jgi:hypothetical protein